MRLLYVERDVHFDREILVRKFLPLGNVISDQNNS